MRLSGREGRCRSRGRRVEICDPHELVELIGKSWAHFMEEKESHIIGVVLEVMQPFAPEGTPLDADTDLFDLIDSAAMINILLTLESRLGIRIQASDLTFDHFQSGRILARRLSSKINA